jgi:hypothetical protein
MLKLKIWLSVNVFVRVLVTDVELKYFAPPLENTIVIN